MTPRAPPDTTTRDPARIRASGDGCAYGAALWCTTPRPPLRPSPTSTSRPPRRSSDATRAATTSGSLPTSATSIALAAESGHSATTVFASPARPAVHARSPARPERPKSPPVPWTVTKTRGALRCASVRAARAASSWTSIAPATDVSSARPDTKTTPAASADACSTACASTPDSTRRAAIAAPSLDPRSITSMRPTVKRPGMQKPGADTGSRTGAWRVMPPSPPARDASGGPLVRSFFFPSRACRRTAP